VVRLDPTEKIIFALMSLVFLLMGIVLLASIVMSAANPYNQITFANVEKLRSSINEVCFTPSQEVSLQFEMPQNTPVLSWLFSILPAWQINSAGDPNYVLYYESFPPGEALGWEVYHNFNNRLIVPLPDNYEGKGVADVRQYAANAYCKFRERNPSLVVDAVVVNNIILNDKYRSDFVLVTSKFSGKGDEKPSGSGGAGGYWEGGPGGPGSSKEVCADPFVTMEEQDPKKGFFGYGTWEGNVFKFKNYMGLSRLERTLIKYQPCGANALCLKTRDGVYKFPLDVCDGKNIKGMQLVYDARQRGKVYAITAGGIIVVTATALIGGPLLTVGGVIGRAAIAVGKFIWKILPFKRTVTVAGVVFTLEEASNWLLSKFLSFKTSDFYLASPCDIKTSTEKIKRYNDDTDETTEVAEERDLRVVSDKCEKIKGTSTTICQNVMKYYLYEYDDNGKLKVVKDKNGEHYHYTCVEKIGDSSSTLIQGDDPPDNFNNEYYSGDCIQVYADTRPKGFCWTDDPWKRDAESNADTKLIANKLGLDSIRDSTAYISTPNDQLSDIIVLGLSWIDMNIIEKVFERKVTWLWPK
jgi:hypothetical protein